MTTHQPIGTVTVSYRSGIRIGLDRYCTWFDDETWQAAAGRAGKKLTRLYDHVALLEKIAPNTYRAQLGKYVKKANATSLSETVFITVEKYGYGTSFDEGAVS